MADEPQAPNAAPATGADGNAGQSPPQEPAAEQVPGWAQELRDQNKQLRTAIGNFGNSLKEMREQTQAPAYAPQQSYQAPPAQDPWATTGYGDTPQTAADLTLDQMRALIQKEANATAYQMASSIQQTYGLDALPRQRAVNSINNYLAEQGQDPIPTDALTRVAPQVERALEQRGMPPTPENAAWVAQMLLQSSQSAAEAEAGAERTAQTAQSNAVSGAANQVQPGQTGAPPPPDGQQGPSEAAAKDMDAYAEGVLLKGLPKEAAQ